MVELKDMEDMEYTLSLFENQNSSCEYIWTPLTYEEKEGQYKNINTGALASYLPLPSGIHTERYMILMIDSSHYLDISSAANNYCNACDLPTTAIFLSLVHARTQTWVKKRNIIFF